MPKRGDHLKVDKGLYSHHGLYIGDGKVVHYSGLADGLSSGPIEVTTLQKFCGGDDIEAVEHSEKIYSENESVERALSRVGENDYHILHNNCEHFVNWCIEGEHISKQAIFAYPIKVIKEPQIEQSIEDRQKLDEFRKRMSDLF